MKIPAKIGAVQIDREVVRLAVVRSGGRRPRVLDLVESPIEGDSESARVAALRDALGRVQSQPAVWVLLVPASWSVLRLLAVPFRSARKVAAAVPFELEPTLAVPLDSLVVSHLPGPTVDGETRVLAVGVRRDSMAEHAALAEQAGLPLAGAYLDAIALTSLWAGELRRQPGARAVLHFRPREALLGVVEDGKLGYLRRLDTDPSEFRTRPADVAREVRNLLRSYAADRGLEAPVESLSITGAQLHEAGRTVFESEVDVPVLYEELAADLPGFARQASAADAISDEFNQWTAPIAAAANAAGGLFHVNLLRAGVFDASRAGKNTARAAVAACALGAVLILSYLFMIYMDHRRTSGVIERYGDAIWQEFQAAYPDIEVARPPNDRGGAESFRLLQEAAIAESSSSRSVPLDVFSAPTLLDLLLDVSAAIDPRVAQIEEIGVRPLRGYRELTIRGRVVDSARYNEVIEKLDASRLFDVDRDQSTRVTEGRRETFTLRARM